jgi:thymidine kinase
MSLEIILGPMFSGKSSRILSIVSRYSALHVPILVIKHSADNRYSVSNEVVTHDNRRVPCVSVQNFSDIDSRFLDAYRVIIIEEAQFFQGLVQFVEDLVDGLKRDVVVVGLDGDSNRRPFGEILQCIPLADKVEKFTALCHRCADGTPGLFTYRNGHQNQQVVVGGANLYESLCRECYHEKHAMDSIV